MAKDYSNDLAPFISFGGLSSLSLLSVQNRIVWRGSNILSFILVWVKLQKPSIDTFHLHCPGLELQAKGVIPKWCRSSSLSATEDIMQLFPQAEQ